MGVPIRQSQEAVKLVRISVIKPIGREDVYNMEVRRYHNFSISGGLVVHNCMDAIRYLIMGFWKKYLKRYLPIKDYDEGFKNPIDEDDDDECI